MSIARPLMLSERIPHVCTIDDVCRILQIGQSTYFAWTNSGRLPFAEIQPRIGRSPRFSGADLQLWIEGHYASRRQKKAS